MNTNGKKNLLSFVDTFKEGDIFYNLALFDSNARKYRGITEMWGNNIAHGFETTDREYIIPNELIKMFFEDVTVSRGGNLFRRSLKKKMNNKKSRSMRKNKKQKSKTLRKIRHKHKI